MRSCRQNCTRCVYINYADEGVVPTLKYQLLLDDGNNSMVIVIVASRDGDRG